MITSVKFFLFFFLLPLSRSLSLPLSLCYTAFVFSWSWTPRSEISWGLTPPPPSAGLSAPILLSLILSQFFICLHMFPRVAAHQTPCHFLRLPRPQIALINAASGRKKYPWILTAKFQSAPICVPPTASPTPSEKSFHSLSFALPLSFSLSLSPFCHFLSFFRVPQYVPRAGTFWTL